MLFISVNVAAASSSHTSKEVTESKSGARLKTLITTKTPSVTKPILMRDKTSKVGFVGVHNFGHYGSDESFFTIGFHRNVSSLDNFSHLAFAALRDVPSDMRRMLLGEEAAKIELVSTISLDSATNLARSISELFNVPVTVVRSPIYPGLEDLLFTFAPALGTLVLKPGLREEEHLIAAEIQIHDLSQIKSIVQWVKDQGYLNSEGGTLFPTPYISYSDFELLEPLFSEIAAKISSSKIISPEITEGQIGCIRAWSEPMIDAIIDVSTTIEHGEQLRKYNRPPVAEPINQGELALALLIDSCQQYQSVIFSKMDGIGLNENYQLTALSHSAEKLSKLYDGDAELENAFKDIGETVPSLQQQRLALIEFIAEKISKKFAMENLVSETTMAAAISLGINSALLVPFAARLFAEGYRLDPLPYCDESGMRSDLAETGFIRASIQIDPFKRILDDLRINFELDVYAFFGIPRTNWMTNEGRELKNSEAKHLFSRIRAEVGI